MKEACRAGRRRKKIWILVTRHLFELSLVEDGFRCVSAIKPGVMGTTGIETCDIVLGVINEIKPDFLIFIDSCGITL